MEPILKSGMVAGVIGHGLFARTTQNAQRKKAQEYHFSDEDVLMTHVAPIINARGTILEMKASGPRFTNLMAYRPSSFKGYRLFEYPCMSEEKQKQFGDAAIELSGVRDLNTAKKYDYPLLISQWFIAHGIPLELNHTHRDICTEFYFHIMMAIGLPLPTECMFPAILGVLATNGILNEII